MSSLDAGMAERTPDNAALALSVDELRRKARRRLVGAVIIALAAAVILPLLLEKDPKPLGEDVSVRIPAVDDSRFVSRLSGKPGDAAATQPEKALPAAPAPKAEAAPTPAASSPIATGAAPAAIAAPASAVAVPAPKKSMAEAEQRLLTPVAKPAAAPPPDPKAAVPPPAPAAKPAAAPPAAPAAPKATEAAAAAAPADGFVVQLAAYADDKGANAFAGRLKKAGYAAYVEPVETSRGTLWRVRVGGFAERAAAEAARAKLKDEGHNGIVAKAK